MVSEVRATGLRDSSQKVWSRYVLISHVGQTLHTVATSFAPAAITRKPAERSSKPSPNLTGIDGSRFLRASLTHKEAITGARVMTKIGPSDWNQPAGTS